MSDKQQQAKNHNQLEAYDENTTEVRESCHPDITSNDDPTVDEEDLEREFNEASSEGDRQGRLKLRRRRHERRERRRRRQANQAKEAAVKQQQHHHNIDDDCISVEPITQPSGAHKENPIEKVASKPQEHSTTLLPKQPKLSKVLLLLSATVVLLAIVNPQFRQRVDEMTTALCYVWRTLLVVLFQIANNLAFVFLEAYSLSTALSCDMAFYMCAHYRLHCEERCSFLP